MKTKLKNLFYYFLYFLSTLKRYNPKQKGNIGKIVWYGAYGNTNIGDDLIYFGIKQYIPANIKIFLSCRQKEPTTDYGVQTFYKNSYLHGLKKIRECDYVLLGGGGLFEYYQELHKNVSATSIIDYLYPLILAKLFNKKYAIIGMGCNYDAFPNLMLRKLFSNIAQSADFIITRDQKSYQGFLNNNGNNPNIKSSFDPVFGLPSILKNDVVKKKDSNETSQFTVGFLLWPYYLHPYFHKTTNNQEIYNNITPEKIKKHQNFCDELKSLFSELKAENINCIFPLFHFSDKVLLDELDCPYSDRITFDSYFEQLTKCDIVVSMRYHVQITSIANNIPVVSVIVQEKMSALVENFGLQPYSMDIDDFSAKKSKEMLLHIYQNKEQIKKEINNRFISVSEEVQTTYSKYINNFIQK